MSLASLIRTYDRQGMLREYLRWPGRLREGLTGDLGEALVARRPEAIVFAGMGGSGAAGEIIKDWLEPILPTPICVVKGYSLPGWVGDGTLVLALSVSGDTEETLMIMKEAHARGAITVGVSSGGAMARLCRRQGIPFLRIRKTLAPRVSFPSMFAGASRLVGQATGERRILLEIRSSIPVLERLSRKLGPDAPAEENPSYALAQSIVGSEPRIYGSERMRAAVMRFKDSLSENAKMFSSCSVLPEMCHNEIVGWEAGLEAFPVVFVMGNNESERMKARFSAVKELVEAGGGVVHTVKGLGRGGLTSILSGLYLLDVCSVYAAILRGIDPTPTKSIEALKEKLSRSGVRGRDDD